VRVRARKAPASAYRSRGSSSSCTAGASGWRASRAKAAPSASRCPWSRRDGRRARPHRRRQREEREARPRRASVRRLSHHRGGNGGKGCRARRRAPPRRHLDGHSPARYGWDGGGSRAEERPADGRHPRCRADLVRDEGRPGALPLRRLRRLPREADQREGLSGASAWFLRGRRIMTAKILVVDDVPQNVRLLEAVLTSHGYTVTSASSGAEALESVRANLPDLVLLDIQLPGMNGYEVCRRIREDAATRFLPVVMITSSDTEVRVNALEAGADDFVTKPFNQQELLIRVRSLVRLKQYHDTIETQTAELAEWNRTLETRVDEQVHELEKMTRLRRFLSPTLAELILSQGEGILESHRREIAVLFADLRGFTSFSATTEPEVVMGVIREFHTAMGNLIRQFDATVGWFAGDGLMVWFNDPIPCDDPAARAVRTAVAMRAAMGELTPKWRRRGHELDFSVGVTLGYATLGRIGFDGRYDYGAVGSVMNLASRLCDEAAPGQVLVNERVFAEVEELVDAEPAGEFVLKGFSKPVRAFNVLDMRPESSQGSAKNPDEALA